MLSQTLDVKKVLMDSGLGGAVGIQEREDREAKKRQADAEAAEIYATFVASFDNEDDKLGKAFVRAKVRRVRPVRSSV